MEYNLTLDTPKFSLTHKLDLPAWFHPGKDMDAKLQEHKDMSKCLWNSHNVRTIGDLVQIETYHKNPDHNKNSKKCTCTNCLAMQAMGCTHLNLCFKECSLILADLSPKYDPYKDDLLNDEITEDDRLAAEANAIGPPTEVKIFDPKVTSSGNLHNHLHIFTNPKRSSPTPTWSPPHLRTPQDTTAFTDSSCTLNSDTRASTGLSMWFGQNDPRNYVAPVGKNIIQTNNSGEILAIHHALMLT